MNFTKLVENLESDDYTDLLRAIEAHRSLDFTPTEIGLLNAGKLIPAIKAMRERTGKGLKDSKEACETSKHFKRVNGLHLTDEEIKLLKVGNLVDATMAVDVRLAQENRDAAIKVSKADLRDALMGHPDFNWKAYLTVYSIGAVKILNTYEVSCIHDGRDDDAAKSVCSRCDWVPSLGERAVRSFKLGL